MGIQQDQAIDLRDKPVFDWVVDGANVSDHVSGDPPLKKDFVKLHEQSMGDAKGISYSWGVREVWNVRDSAGQHISSFEAMVPHVQGLVIETISVISVDSSASQAARDAVLQSFQSYDPQSQIEPMEWARRALPPDEPLGLSLFDVRQKFRLVKQGSASEDRSGVNAIRRRIETGGLSEGPQKYWCALVSTELLADLPEPARLPEERLLPVGSDVTDSALARIEIEKVVVSAANPSDCDISVGGRWDHKVGDLLSYPEFMIRWEIVHIRIGCVDVALHLPVLYTRRSTKQLWVFGFFPNDPLGYLGKVVEHCALLGVGAGVVAGLVFANFAAAIAAFKHVFLECFKQKLQETIRCVIPGLALLTATEDWRRV